MSRRYFGNDLVLGTTSGGEPVILSEEHRRTHMHVTGVTNSGKSRFLASLIRQDIDQHRRNQQGLLLLDPHGELYDSALAYIADNPRHWKLPTVLIDLRKDDSIVAYNILKHRPGMDAAVIATAFVEAITYAFGGADPTETPRLARIGRIFIQALIEANRTLFDVLPLLQHADGGLRAALIRELPPSTARNLLEQLNELNKREFDTWVESFTNRISPMLSNRIIGSMLGQDAAPSFDFDRAIDEGAIVLVSLATERGKIAESDSRLFASLMLSDLWQVAKMRGKKGAGFTKPFAVYIDEFQSMLTPTLGQQLDQARGFGLQFILAQQYPGQTTLYGGEHGRAIASSVMVNAKTKVAFQAAAVPEERAQLVAALFDGAIDVHKLQPNLTSFQTVGYEHVHRILRGGSTATGKTTTAGTTSSVTLTEAKTVARGAVRGSGEAETDATSTFHSHSDGYASSLVETVSQGDGTSTPELAGVDATFPTTVSHTDGAGIAHAEATSETDGEGESESYATSRNSFRAKTKSVAKQTGEAITHGETFSASETETDTASWHEEISLEPILEERHTQLMSIENQAFAFGQLLASQPPRHAHVRIADQRLPVAFRSLDCPESPVSSQYIERIRCRILGQTTSALMLSDALALLERARAARLPDTSAALRSAAAGRRRARPATLKDDGDDNE